MNEDERAAESLRFEPKREYLDLGRVGDPPCCDADYDARPHLYLDLETGLAVVNREQYEYQIERRETYTYEARLGEGL